MVSINSSTNFQNKNHQKLGFGRAFTDKESEVYQKGLAEVRNSYVIDRNEPAETNKLNNTTLILPDFYAPGGTITSDDSLKYIKLMQKLNGITVVQGLPRGPVTKDNLSPFSSSPFEIGDHLIDLNKLDAPDLKTAYNDFKALPEDNELKQKFNKFNEENPHLERYGMLDALAKEYGTDYSPNWKGEKAESDKNLFNYESEEPPQDKKARQEELKKDDTVDFYKYKQFIATEQHLETKENLNKEGIKLFGDCLIGFSPRDQWAFKPAFEEGKSTGCPGDGGKFNDWGLPCLDFSKLYNQDGSLGAAGKILKKKFDVFLSNYDGARIDAGWQLSNPHTNKGPEYQGTKMLHIMDLAINDQIKNGHDIKKEDINIEALGGPDQAVNLTKNKYPHIQITRYAGKDWGRTDFYRQNMGYKLNGFTIGVGCHDDLSLIQLEKEKRGEQAGNLSSDLKTPVKNAEDFRNTKFAEIFTARNQFFTAPDAMGDERRLNNPNDQKAPNWTIKVPQNYEETLYKNLSEGKGLNTPKSLATAIRAKMGETPETKKILDFLDKAGRILRQQGPNTTAEANKLAVDNPNALGEVLTDAPAPEKTPVPTLEPESPKPETAQKSKNTDLYEDSADFSDNKINVLNLKPKNPDDIKIGFTITTPDTYVHWGVTDQSGKGWGRPPEEILKQMPQNKEIINKDSADTPLTSVTVKNTKDQTKTISVFEVPDAKKYLKPGQKIVYLLKHGTDPRTGWRDDTKSGIQI